MIYDAADILKNFVQLIAYRKKDIDQLPATLMFNNLCVEIKLGCNPACQTIIYLHGEEIGFGNEKCQRYQLD